MKRESPSEAMMVATQNYANKKGIPVYIFKNTSEHGPDFSYTTTYEFLTELTNFVLYKTVEPQTS